MNNINADIGLIGLGVMGSSLALNMESNGYTVAVHNRTSPQIDNIVNNRAKYNKIIGFESLDDFVNSIKTPRKIMLMVVAGSVVDDYIQKLIPLLDQGDIIIDGGNSHYPDTSRRTNELESKGITVCWRRCLWWGRRRVKGPIYYARRLSLCLARSQGNLSKHICQSW
jgi:6-phosphogluconate dehydrogenase